MVLGVRMRAMLLSSLTVVAFSIFPIILDRYGASSDAVWTASSLVLFGSGGVLCHMVHGLSQGVGSSRNLYDQVPAGGYPADAATYVGWPWGPPRGERGAL